MRMSEIKKKAKALGVKTLPNMKKEEIIWAIQRKEGNFDCFGTTADYCDQEKCWFKEDCLALTKQEGEIKR